MKDDVRIVNDAHRLIVSELQRIRPQKATGQGVMICCPFHADSTPSLSVNLEHTSKKPAGLFYCFGCGATGLWNKLAKKMNLRTVDQRTAQQMTEFWGRRPSHKLLESENLYDKMVREWELDFVEPWPVDRTWRGFPGNFLANAINAMLAVDTKRKSEIVVLPVLIGEDHAVGYVKGLLNKVKGQLSYVNSSGDWSKTQGLFGYELAAKLLAAGATVLYIVEGPRDALRLLYYGVPAVAILGAKIWSKAKRDLIIALNPERIILWMDNDQAGISATNKLKTDFKQFIPVKFVNANKLLLEAQKEYGHSNDKIDVANCPLKLFKKKVRSHHPDLKPGGWRC